MPTTPLHGLRSPGLTDAPNVPQDIGFLASDAASWLNRAFPCTSTTRPTGIGTGFHIWETDTGNELVWNGGAWVTPANFAGTGGGGGGGGGGTTTSTVSATYAATSAQSIPNTTDTVVSFSVEQQADPIVTRSGSGPGHRFTLAQTRLWTITATIRFATATAGGRTFELRTGTGLVLAKEGDPVINGPYTRNLAISRRLVAGTSLEIIARHDAGVPLSLEPLGGGTCHIDIAGV